MSEHPLETRAATVVAANKYLTLATVDGDGRPWATPVYFTPDGHTHVYWVSTPEARHSRNVAANPDVSIAIFDSTVPIGGAEAVFLTAHAQLVPADELDECARLFASRLPEVRDYTADALRAPAELRLYRATVTEAWVLVRGGDPDHGTGIDSRRRIWPTAP
jgi:nitroimidazol reductase NimA-like FMN-containing flavoprotein (pyridoxamine 5'-phosphate oxidase superfamily)